MQTRSMSRIPDISDVTITNNNNIYENRLKKIYPEIEKSEVKNTMITRSMNKKRENNVNFETKNKNYHFSNLLENNKIDIDFDESSRSWMRNKRKLKNGEYCYTSKL